MKQAAAIFMLMAMLLPPITAKAGFTIAESIPGQLTMMSNAEPAARTQDISLEVTFVPHRVVLAIAGKNALKDALEEMKLAEAIHITTAAMQAASPALQKSRARLVKQWLVANGVSETKITLIESHAANNARPNSATITLIPTKPPITSSYTSPQSVQLARLEASAKGEQLANDKLRINMMRKLIALAQSKQVKAEDALTMLGEMLAMHEGSAAITIDLPRTWTLDNRKTLRENLAEWAKIANWQVPDWRSNTTFDFPNATLQGSFLEVLAELAKAVPALDFVANRGTRVITVVDVGQR